MYRVDPPIKYRKLETSQIPISKHSTARCRSDLILAYQKMQYKPNILSLWPEMSAHCKYSLSTILLHSKQNMRTKIQKQNKNVATYSKYILTVIGFIVQRLQSELKNITKNSIRDARTPQPGEIIFNTTRYRSSEIKIGILSEQCQSYKAPNNI